MLDTSKKGDEAPILPEDIQDLGHLWKLLGEPEPQKAKLQRFAIEYYMTPEAEEDDRRIWGYLELGHGLMMDVQRPIARYRRGLRGDWQDISDCVTQKADIDSLNTPITFTKHRTPTSVFSFTVTITHFGTDQAMLKGTVLDDDGKIMQYLDGSAQGAAIETTIDQHTAKIVPPAGLNPNATLQGILSINPMGFYRITDNQGKSSEVWCDRAQRRGDEIMHLMMLHAVNRHSQEELLPNLPSLTPSQQEISKQNPEFLRRGGIHLLAESLKNTPGMESSIARKIKDKFQYYIKMMTSLEPPEKDDPVTLYGWDREKNKADLELHREQYHRVTLWCYEAGYKEMCPEWSNYLSEPVYWYQMLAVYLISPGHMETWLNTLNLKADEKSQSGPAQKIFQWSSKLTLLKNAAQAQGKDTKNLNVEELVNYFNVKAVEHVIMSQKIDNEWLKHLQETWKNWKDSDAFKNLNEKAKTEAQQLQATLLSELTSIAQIALNPENRLLDQFHAWRKGKLPPGTNYQHISAAELINYLEDHNLDKLGLERLFGEPEKVEKKGWFQKLKAKGKKGVSIILKGIFYLGSIVAFIYSAATGSLAKLDPAAIVQSVAGVLSVVIEGAGRLARWAIPKLLSMETRFVRPLMGWLLNFSTKAKTFAGRVVRAVAGNLTNLVRAVSFVGCIAGIVMSYQEMQRTANDPESKTEHTLATIQFWLGVVEGVALTGVLLLEMAGYAGTMATMVCGMLASAVGVIAIVVVLIWIFAFPPDPFKYVKGFLNGEGKEMGAYD
ncbi:hypothetical protein BDZ91DRAFT_787118 [Kalaharituber pfeilii]|nr:hypothetical protein BDZ91DRAFT_787118 [Kalaharituber pfeilii]